MRRASLSALLIVCLVTFLCPEVAKPSVFTVTKAPDCCSKMPGCKMTPEQTSHHHPCRHESQPRSCCTVSCSAMILFARPQMGSLLRALTAALLQSTTQPRLHDSNGRPLRRRGFDSLHSLRLGARHARASLCSRGFTKSQQERIMKYLLLIAAIMTLTSATSISSNDAGCCGGGCCPGPCCMTMTR